MRTHGMPPRCALCAALWWAVAGACSAQQAPAGSNKAKDDPLNKTVQLVLGRTDLGKMTATLSEQTDLKVRAESCLKDRTLTVEMDGATLRETLDSIAALNDWMWEARPSDEGTFYVIMRRPARPPAQVQDVGRAIGQALPLDFREYLGILAERTPAARAAKAREAFDRARTAAQRSATRLTSSVQDALQTAEDVPFARLDARQKHDLIVALVFPCFGSAGADLWRDAPEGLHRSDISMSRLELQGDVLMVVTPNATGREYSGGANIVYPFPFIPKDW